jgi:hypothetical protein
MCNRTAAAVFQGSAGEETKAYYACLTMSGPLGPLCVNLFRAQKCSERAKKYRGGVPGKASFTKLAYDKKNWSMRLLCEFLENVPRIRWGWKLDPKASFHQWVLYVDIPPGQVSFHAETRGGGPDYPGDWDGLHRSRERILAFCDAVHASAGDRTATKPLFSNPTVTA